MTEVEIEYCVPCGYLDTALETERALLDRYGRDLEAVRLKTGHGGVFKVTVDGETVFDKERAAYDLDRIVDEVGRRL